MRSTTSREFFEGVYRSGPDPWHFATDRSELDRYERVLAHVEPGRHRTAFEPGCSVGVLTAALATRCERVLAIDIAANAVDRARQRCVEFAGVRVEQGALPEACPTRPVDLIVFSELGYYFTSDVLAELGSRLGAVVAPGGRLIAAHWTGVSDDHVLAGLEVHRILRETVGLVHVDSAEHRWPRPDAPNGGSAEGIVLDVWDAAR